MKQQHEKIKGYRTLTDTEIFYMNECKEKGAELKVIVDTLRSIPNIDQKWLNIAEIDLQKGIMFLVRSIAKPDSF